MASPGNRHCANCIGAVIVPYAYGVYWAKILFDLKSAKISFRNIVS